MERHLCIGLVVFGLALSGCLDSGESVEVMEPEFDVAKTTQALQEGNGYGAFLVDRDVVTNIKHTVAAIRTKNTSPNIANACGAAKKPVLPRSM